LKIINFIRGDVDFSEQYWVGISVGGGEAVVQIPDYFVALTEEGETTIQLTPTAQF